MINMKIIIVIEYLKPDLFKIIFLFDTTFSVTGIFNYFVSNMEI